MKLKDAVLSLIRHSLGIGAAFAIGKGWFDESTAATVVTAVVGVVAALWGATDEYKAANK